MTRRHWAMAISSGFVLAGSAVAQTVVINEPEVRTLVVREGYSDPILVERDGNLWRAKTLATDGGAEVTLFVNAEGQILGASDVVRTRSTGTTTTTTTTAVPVPVTQASVATIVMNAGFHNVHDIDFLDGKGVWKAEADDIAGKDYELHVDATTGRIVHVEDD